MLGGAAALGVTAALSGPAVLARAQSPKRGGTLTFRGWDPPLFDPTVTTAYRVQIPVSFTHSGLLKHRAGPGVAPGTFPIEGDLAESWSQPNETTYVFKLHRGVRWHPKPPVNGRELTAEDVRYTVAWQGRSERQQLLRPAREVRVDLHVEAASSAGGGIAA